MYCTCISRSGHTHSQAVQSALYFYTPENYKESLLACKGQFWHLSGSLVKVDRHGCRAIANISQHGEVPACLPRAINYSA